MALVGAALVPYARAHSSGGVLRLLYCCARSRRCHGADHSPTAVAGAGHPLLPAAVARWDPRVDGHGRCASPPVVTPHPRPSAAGCSTGPLAPGTCYLTTQRQSNLVLPRHITAALLPPPPLRSLSHPWRRPPATSTSCESTRRPRISRPFLATLPRARGAIKTNLARQTHRHAMATRLRKKEKNHTQGTVDGTRRWQPQPTGTGSTDDAQPVHEVKKPSPVRHPLGHHHHHHHKTVSPIAHRSTKTRKTTSSIQKEKSRHREYRGSSARILATSHGDHPREGTGQPAPQCGVRRKGAPDGGGEGEEGFAAIDPARDTGWRQRTARAALCPRPPRTRTAPIPVGQGRRAVAASAERGGGWVIHRSIRRRSETRGAAQRGPRAATGRWCT